VQTVQKYRLEELSSGESVDKAPASDGRPKAGRDNSACWRPNSDAPHKTATNEPTTANQIQPNRPDAPTQPNPLFPRSGSIRPNSTPPPRTPGTYSRLIAEIHFARRMGYYLIQIYIPSSLIVVISWVSFWLHRNASPARVQLGVTTVLTMTTLMSSTNAALPKISYVKSIDIFLGTCFVMVFAALLEYATVGYLGKRIAMRKAHAQHAQSQAQAKLYAQLQAHGEPVPLVLPVTSSTNANPLATGATAAGQTASPLPAPGQTTGNLGLFGNSTEPSSANELLSTPARSLPLAALLNDSSLLSANNNQQQQQLDASRAQQSACLQVTLDAHHSNHNNNHHHHHHHHQHNHQHACQSNWLPCALNDAGAHHQPNQRPSARPPALITCHQCRRQHEPCSAPAPTANCPQHQQQTHCHHQHYTDDNCAQHQDLACNGGSHGADPTPVPPRRAGQQQAIQASGCQCQSSRGQQQQQRQLKSGSQTLPRPDMASGQQQQGQLASGGGGGPGAQLCCPVQQPPSYGLARGACAAIPASCNEPHHLSLPSYPQQSYTLHASPRKAGSAAAAAAAAATFVNLHRKNKGLPPSTNPNFAPFGSLPTTPYNRHLETIFGIRPSDIDKYSRVVFPVCFVCFQLMYWIVYLHISAFLEPDQLQNQQQQPTPITDTQQQQAQPVIS
jgi:hypothetical protein